jgi:uncharacterized protein YhfF
MSQEADRYWAQFISSLPENSDRPSQYYEMFSFGTSKDSAVLLASLVLAGFKTATGSLQWVYEADGRPPPRTGDYSIVTDGDQPVCIIRDTDVTVMPYGEVDAAFAWDGGEEDRTLETWRRIYWEYIELECARIGRQPSPKTPLVCERFRVVYKEPLKPG